MSNERQVFWAAKIDYATFRIYVRQKKTRKSIGEKYTASLSPAGNVYAASEIGALTAIHGMLKDHIDKANQVLAILDKPSIPLVDLDNINSGAEVELPWDESEDRQDVAEPTTTTEPEPKSKRPRKRA